MHQLSPVIRLSRHATIRMQQRSIPPQVIDLLLDFATPVPAGGGAMSYHFTRITWDEAMAGAGSAAPQLQRYRNAYVVEGRDGTVITAAWLN